MTYKTDSNNVAAVVMPSANVQSSVNYTYDELDRLEEKQVSFQNAKNATEHYTYKTYTSGGETMQTPLVSSIKYTTYEGTAQVDKTLSYVYDSLGNITSVKEDGVVKQQFYYDNLNRLTRENNAYVGYTYTYTYDNAGNVYFDLN